MNRQIISKFTKTSILGLLLIVGIVSSVLAASEKVTVWARNDKGEQNSKTGTTSAVGEAGQIRTTIKATHSNPLVKEKAGYKGFQTVK